MARLISNKNILFCSSIFLAIMVMVSWCAPTTPQQNISSSYQTSANSKKIHSGSMVAAASGQSTVSVHKPATNQQAQQQALLTYEQQQELLEQLSQLQRQTQQLLAAQQSLAAVAAAAAANGGNTNGDNSSGPSSSQSNHHHSHQQPSNRQQLTSSASTSSQNQQNQLLSSSIRSNAQHKPQQQQPKSSQQGKQQQQQIQKQVPASSDADSGNVPNIEGSSSSSSLSSSSSSNSLPQGPQINWGKCPELEPSENEKLAKANVITKCLENTPLPVNITRDSVELHREQIAACALRAEGWFTSVGGYDFQKAEKEIKNKRLQNELEQQVLNYHVQCRAESEEKYPTSNSSIIAQIQLYQACMDYFISDVCGIEVNESPNLDNNNSNGQTVGNNN